MLMVMFMLKIIRASQILFTCKWYSRAAFRLNFRTLPMIRKKMVAIFRASNVVFVSTNMCVCVYMYVIYTPLCLCICVYLYRYFSIICDHFKYISIYGLPLGRLYYNIQKTNKTKPYVYGHCYHAFTCLCLSNIKQLITNPVLKI